MHDHEYVVVVGGRFYTSNRGNCCITEHPDHLVCTCYGETHNTNHNLPILTIPCQECALGFASFPFFELEMLRVNCVHEDVKSCYNYDTSLFTGNVVYHRCMQLNNRQGNVMLCSTLA